MRYYFITRWDGTREIREFPNEGYAAEYVNNLPANSKGDYEEVSRRLAKTIKKNLEREAQEKGDELLTDTLLKFSGMKKAPRFF